MKKAILLLSIVSAISSITVEVQAAPDTKEVTVSVNDVFVSDSVESIREVKIVASGVFSNSCYRWSRADITNISETTHIVQAKAWVTTGAPCLTVLVPYSREVNLGYLSKGEHTLRFVGRDETFFDRKFQVQ
jgi:hypothetical protein